MRRRRTEEHEGDHLRILSICYWVVAGLAALGSLLPLIFMLLTLLLLIGPGESDGSGPFLILFEIACILAGLAFASCLAFTALCLSKRRHRKFCLVIAALVCLFVPVGTLLGVFTIIVLTKDSVRVLFGERVVGSSTP